MAKVMKLVGEDGALVKTRGLNPREVQDCFVKSYVELGWVEIKPVVDDRPNPEFLAAYKSGIKAQRGPGPRFTGDPAGAPAEATGAEPGKAKGKTAKDRQAEATGAEPGKE